jgi:hypothetical protein
MYLGFAKRPILAKRSCRIFMVVHLVLILITCTLNDEPLSCLASHLHHHIFNAIWMTAKSVRTIESRTHIKITGPSSDTDSDFINSEAQVSQGVKQYFEGRWKGDVNFYDALEYEIVIHANGRVRSIQGVGDISKRYLSITQFLVPDTQIVRASGQEHIAWVILYSNGEVQVQVNTIKE